MVDTAQVQAFLLGYLSGQLGLLIVPDTPFRTWSQPAGTHNKRQTFVRFVPDTAGPVENALTFLAVVFIIMQHEAAAALTAVAPEGVDALVLAASVFFGTLVDICRIVK